MGKTKVADKKEKKSEITAVKAGRVTKATETPKAKSKAAGKSAGKAVEKEVKKASKKSKKEPTPEPSSDSESDSSDSDSEVPDAPAAEAAEAESSDSDSSDSESEEEKPAAKVTKAAAKAESSDSESDSESEAEDKPAAKADATSDSDSDSDADSSDSSDSDEEAPSKKRKAEEAAEPAVKKTKTEAAPAPQSEGIKNLFVGSLSWNIDEDWLRREFEHFGTITGCRVISDRETGRSKGFGYVEFEDAAVAATAQKEMMGYELDGRALNVDFSTPREKPANKTFDRANKYGDKRSAPSNTLFLGNLSFDCTNEVVQETFQEYGSVSRVSLPTDRETGALKGFGYVDFSSTDEATAALEALNGAEIAGRAIRLDYAAARDDSNGGGRGGGFGGGRGGGRGGFGDRGGRGGGRGGRGGFGDRGGRGGGRGGRGGFGDRGGRGGSFNRGGFGDFKGSKVSFD